MYFNVSECILSCSISKSLGKDSNCSDALTQEGYDAYAYALNEPWNHEKIFRSTLACDDYNKEKALGKTFMQVPSRVYIIGCLLQTAVLLIFILILLIMCGLAGEIE